MRLPTRREFLLAGAGAVSLAASAHAQELPLVGMQLHLLIDVSGSVNETRYRMQKEGYIEALGNPRVLAAIRNLPTGSIALMATEWALLQSVRVPWTRISDSESMRDFLRQFTAPPRPSSYLIGNWTAVGDALNFGGSQFDKKFQSRAKLIDISGDGHNNMGAHAPEKVRDELVAKGVTINGLPIIVTQMPKGVEPQSDLFGYYRDHVVGGEGHILEPSRGYEDFPRAILRKLVLEIA